MMRRAAAPTAGAVLIWGAAMVGGAAADQSGAAYRCAPSHDLGRSGAASASLRRATLESFRGGRALMCDYQQGSQRYRVVRLLPRDGRGCRASGGAVVCAPPTRLKVASRAARAPQITSAEPPKPRAPEPLTLRRAAQRLGLTSQPDTPTAPPTVPPPAKLPAKKPAEPRRVAAPLTAPAPPPEPAATPEKPSGVKPPARPAEPGFFQRLARSLRDEPRRPSGEPNPPQAAPARPTPPPATDSATAQPKPLAQEQPIEPRQPAPLAAAPQDTGPPSPGPGAQGKISVPPSWTVDLDQARIGAGAASDLWYRAPEEAFEQLDQAGVEPVPLALADGPRDLIAQNGAVAALMPGGATRAVCEVAALSEEPIPFAELAPNRVICARTNEGRWAKITVVTAESSRSSALGLRFETW